MQCVAPPRHVADQRDWSSWSRALAERDTRKTLNVCQARAGGVVVGVFDLLSICV